MTQKNEAPEEIWAFYAPEIEEDNPQCTIVAGDGCMHGAQKYIHADHALALVAAEREACAGIATLHGWPIGSVTEAGRFELCQEAGEEIAIKIRARTDADAQAALEARDKRVRKEALREALPVTSALAAAISLLDRARLQAPSDKMFEQMVLDYQRALDDFRAALQTDTGGKIGE